ncbi:hypothetical protein EYC80_009633 [Monilinia laxa]|uniref:LITAF domain-containing protein n=1 Tax=Monilinia laxa TaxID=61186 RepID=A0A5N6JYI0_MONLA|nr:hypothetical protein EYC80_009633 [Monilinia laxa]
MENAKETGNGNGNVTIGDAADVESSTIRIPYPHPQPNTPNSNHPSNSDIATRETEKVACGPNAIDENREMEMRSQDLGESEDQGQSQSQYLVPLSVLQEESRLVGCPGCGAVGFTVVRWWKRSGSTEIPITVNTAASAEVATAGGTVQK